MSIANARKFILTVLTDRDLYERINNSASVKAVQTLLADEGMEFNYADFDEAYFSVLTQCGNEEEARLVKEIRLWWDCLGQALEHETSRQTDTDSRG